MPGPRAPELRRGRAALLLDLDGTLLDTLPGLTAAVNAALHEVRHRLATRTEVQNWVGNGVHALLHRALTRTHHLRADGALLAVALDSFEHHYGAQRHADCRPYPGALSLLRGARGAGIGVACVTNKPAIHARALLDATHLAGYFDAVIGGDTAAHIKPHPEPIEKALRRLNCGREAALMVGDSTVDVAAARAAGVAVVTVRAGYGRSDPACVADAQVQSLQEVPAVWQLLRARMPAGATTVPTAPVTPP